MGEKDKILKNLLADAYEKPKSLDHNIMREIRIAAEKKAQVEQETVKESSFVWVYVLIGLLFVGGLIYSFSILKVDFSANSNLWIMFSAVIVPLAIDAVLKLRKQKAEI